MPITLASIRGSYPRLAGHFVGRWQLCHPAGYHICPGYLPLQVSRSWLPARSREVVGHRFCGKFLFHCTHVWSTSWETKNFGYLVTCSQWVWNERILNFRFKAVCFSWPIRTEIRISSAEESKWVFWSKTVLRKIIRGTRIIDSLSPVRPFVQTDFFHCGNSQLAMAQTVCKGDGCQ